MEFQFAGYKDDEWKRVKKSTRAPTNKTLYRRAIKEQFVSTFGRLDKINMCVLPADDCGSCTITSFVLKTVWLVRSPSDFLERNPDNHNYVLYNTYEKTKTPLSRAKARSYHSVHE